MPEQFPHTTNKRQIYLASSWRNQLQPTVLRELRSAGHEVYDFRNPCPPGFEGSTGFGWKEIDPNWQDWNNVQFRNALGSPEAKRGFDFDIEALLCADTVVLLLPAGNDAHLEAGHAGIGTDKDLFVVTLGEKIQPGLMYKTAQKICLSMSELISAVGVV